MLLRLSLQLGVAPRRLWIVAVMVAAFPCTVDMAWLSSMQWSVRQCMMLLALTSFVDWWRRRSLVAALITLLACVLGLGGHWLAFVAPIMCGAWIVVFESASIEFTWPRAFRDPLLWVLTAIAAEVAIYAQMLVPSVWSGVQTVELMATNATKALWSLLPSFLRESAFVALRSDGADIWVGILATVLWAATLALAGLRSAGGRLLLA